LEAVDALIAVDIGNTRIGIAISDADGVHSAARTACREADAWRAALSDAWAVAEGRRRAVVIGSVNADHTPRVADAVREICGVTPVRVRDDIPLPLTLEIENAREVGVDRVCSAAAAYDRLREACAVASFGTAVTIDCVSGDGHFLGGAILPGFEMSCDALHKGTAALPRVTPGIPRSPFGRNTHDAIVNGVTYGIVGALREIVERFATELRTWPRLVITGGDAPLVRELAEFVDDVVPNLCLMGIALAYRRAASQP